MTLVAGKREVMGFTFEWKELPSEMENVPPGHGLFVNGVLVADVISSDTVNSGFTKSVRWVWTAGRTPSPALPYKIERRDSSDCPVEDPEVVKTACEAYVRRQLEAQA